MKYKMYAIKDNKSTEFFNPHIEMNDDTAKRNFALTVNTAENIISFAPFDFDLYFIGNWDSVSGKFEDGCIPSFVANGESLVGVKK